MNLNMAFELQVALRLDEIPWRTSRKGEVDRRMLERAGAESGWATTVVRYPPGSRFPAHQHPSGEELLVLDGVFSDAQGHYPKYTYVRNPPGSGHTPYSEDGCLLFVKLCQMGPEHHEQLVKRNGPGDAHGEMRLYTDPIGEHVAFQRFERGASLQAESVEILILDGKMALEGQPYPALSWLRFPQGSQARLEALEPSLIWKKQRNLM